MGLYLQRSLASSHTSAQRTQNGDVKPSNLTSNDHKTHKTEWLESRSWKPSSTGQVFQTTSSFLPNLEIVAVESPRGWANADVPNMLFWAPKKQKSSPQHISKQLIKKRATKSNQIQRYMKIHAPFGLPIWEVIQFLNPPIPRKIQGSSRHMSFCATERRSLMMVLKGDICRLIDGAMGYRNIG